MMMRRDSVAGFIVYYALAGESKINPVGGLGSDCSSRVGFFLSWGLSTSGVEVAKVAKETVGRVIMLHGLC